MRGASGHRRVPDDYTEALLIPLLSIDEQLRVVKRLDATFEKIDHAIGLTQKNNTNSQKLFDNSIAELFHTRNGAVNLGEVCDFQNGFAFKSSLFKDSGSPVLRISNIQNDEISIKRTVYTDPRDYKENLERYWVNKGDLVIAMSGATTGKVALSNSDVIWLQNQRVGRFITGDRLNKNYLYYFLKTQISKNLEISKGAAQPNLSTEQIKSIQLPDISLEMQQEIVDQLNQLNSNIIQLKDLHKLKIRQLNSLKQSMLTEVFSDNGVN